jgi:hypothetical protein
MTGAVETTPSTKQLSALKHSGRVSSAPRKRSGGEGFLKNTAGSARDETAPTISKWVAAFFPGGMAATEKQIKSLVQEAADAARSDYGVESALEWADDYVFPPGVVEGDTASLAVAGFDFEIMVKARLESLSADRLSNSRVERLRTDNPERALLLDLVIGMKVHLPEGFHPNGHQPRTDLRDIYADVAPAMNKMYYVIIGFLFHILPTQTFLRTSFLNDVAICQRYNGRIIRISRDKERRNLINGALAPIHG